MTIDALGAWGDFIGGIAVVAGLVFVGMQLLGANRQTRAATIQLALEMQMHVDSQLAMYADVWDDVVTNAEISEAADRRRAIILFNVVVSSIENRFHQYNAGFLDKTSHTSTLSALRRTLSCSIYREWRESIGASTHSTDFMTAVDSIALEIHGYPAAEPGNSA